MNYGEETLRALAGDEFERLHWVEYRPASKPPGLYLTREKAGALPLDNPLRGRHPTGDLDAPVLPVPFTAAQLFAFEAMAGPFGLFPQMSDETLDALHVSAPSAYALAVAAKEGAPSPLLREVESATTRANDQIEAKRVAPQERSRPKWKLWTSVPHVALWEAVSLVLDIDPNSLKHSPHGWMAGPGQGPVLEPRSFPTREKYETFEQALDFAERAANYAGPIHLRIGLASGMNRRTAQVSLPEVVAFFVSCEWSGIPAPLLALLTVSARMPAATATPEATAEELAPESEPKHPATLAPSLQSWKSRVQAEATTHWIRQLAVGAQPSVHSIVGSLHDWCETNNVRTTTRVVPSARYLRQHVLSGKHWAPPSLTREQAKKHVAQVAQLAVAQVAQK